MGEAWEATALALLLAAMLAVPAAAAEGSPEDGCQPIRYAITPELSGSLRVCSDGQPPGLEQPTPPGLEVPELPEQPAPLESHEACRDGAYGRAIGSGGQGVFVCVLHENEPPSAAGLELPDLEIGDPGDPGLDQGACPEGTQGTVVALYGMQAGACLLTEHEPIKPFEGHAIPEIDTSSCQVGGRQGEDPSITWFNGGVAVCLFLILEPGGEGHLPAPDPDPDPGLPPVSVDLEPCSARAVDPTVHIGDGYVMVCVEYGFY